jgi:hypothetical protein
MAKQVEEGTGVFRRGILTCDRILALSLKNLYRKGVHGIGQLLDWVFPRNYFFISIGLTAIERGHGFVFVLDCFGS